MKKCLPVILIVFSIHFVFAQDDPETPWIESGIDVEVFANTQITVDFNHVIRLWDGFGVNYVETAQTRDYEYWPQEYGGFSLMTEAQRQTILNLIFGEDGLKPGLTKLFLDCWHEGYSESDNDNTDPYQVNADGFDHQTTTQWMRYFNREGLRITRERGSDLTMMTTLYGPPAWMTRQKFVLGRDFDHANKEELAEYMAAWVRFLKDEDKLSVQYLSFHNEGDAYYRWPRDGSNAGEDHRDYNMLWQPGLVTEMMKITRKMLDHHGLSHVGLTPGETQTWYRFHMWGYADAIVSDSMALKHLDLITSHSFANYKIPHSVYYGDWRSNGIDILRSEKPGLHAWVTSMSWGKMDVWFVENIRRNIYMTKVNGIIPWAVLQRTGQWAGGDPNPGTAIKVNDDGSYVITSGYYFYKQVCRAGQPGMGVASVVSLDPACNAIAFSGNGTANPDALILVNIAEKEKKVNLTIKNCFNQTFDVVRSSDTEHYQHHKQQLTNHQGKLEIQIPPRSVTTLYQVLENEKGELND